MYKNLEMYLASGNLLESLATYDFKNESPWSDVNSETNPLDIRKPFSFVRAAVRLFSRTMGANGQRYDEFFFYDLSYRKICLFQHTPFT